MKRVIFVYLAILALTTIAPGVSYSQGQTPEQKQLRVATRAIFEQLDEGQTQKLKGLVDEQVEVFDSTYLLRVDGWEDFEDYISNLRGFITVLKTSIRQPTVRIIGMIGIVNFYYSQDYLVAKERRVNQQLELDPVDEIPIMGELTNELGRGTIVFVKAQGTWKAVTIHLSTLPTESFE